MIVRSFEDVSDPAAAEDRRPTLDGETADNSRVPSRNGGSGVPARPLDRRQVAQSSLSSRTDRNASCEISTFPTCFIRFLPSFCFSRSFRFREISPP